MAQPTPRSRPRRQGTLLPRGGSRRSARTSTAPRSVHSSTRVDHPLFEMPAPSSRLATASESRTAATPRTTVYFRTMAHIQGDAALAGDARSRP